MTVPDAYVLVKKLREAKDLTITNGVYTAVFDSKKFPTSQGPYGLRYVFELTDAIEKCPEYLVHPKVLVKWVSFMLSF